MMCDSRCFQHQVKGITLCMEKTAEDNLIHTNRIDIDKGPSEVLADLSANSLMHFHVSIDSTSFHRLSAFSMGYILFSGSLKYIFVKTITHF